VYYVWVALLTVANVGALCSTLFMIPGNWLILLFTTVFAFFVQPAAGGGIHGWTLAALAVLAIAGEIAEMLAGARGAAKRGASRRSILLSLVGAIVGSILGAAAGTPVPVLGTVVGALGGAMLGAFAGAYIGETWGGKSTADSFSVGTAAAVGRLFGTLWKVAFGAAMVVGATADAVIN
jgi:uncharacterized protein YqgC (DUF456 family)